MKSYRVRAEPVAGAEGQPTVGIACYADSELLVIFVRQHFNCCPATLLQRPGNFTNNSELLVTFARQHFNVCPATVELLPGNIPATTRQLYSKFNIFGGCVLCVF